VAEQLLAESTGKIGKESFRGPGAIGEAESYGNDRVFAYLRLESRPIARRMRRLKLWRKQASQSCTSRSKSRIDCEEFFRWKLRPPWPGQSSHQCFQPAGRRSQQDRNAELTTSMKQRASCQKKPFFTGDGVKLYADARNTEALKNGKTLAEILKTHLSRAGAGDYFAVLGYTTMNAENEATLQGIRTRSETPRSWRLFSIWATVSALDRTAYKGGPTAVSPANHLRRLH